MEFKMALGKQSKVISEKQVEIVLSYIQNRRNNLRNKVIFLLSVKSGLRAKEISELTWAMISNSHGEIGDTINLTNNASKGNSGRIVPINKHLKLALIDYYEIEKNKRYFDIHTSRLIRTERSINTSAQVIVNMFKNWYQDLGFVGCSSHSGRRTFITNASKKISLVGGSLRDVQVMAGHKNLQTTQRYIDYDTECQRRVVDLV